MTRSPSTPSVDVGASQSRRDGESNTHGDVEKQDAEKANLAPQEIGTGDQGDADVSDNQRHLVWWDGDNDPENPYNWPSWRKFTNCACISAFTFLAPLASSIFAPGVPDLMLDFGETSQQLGTFVVSVYVLGFAVGPMLMAPLSEMYGRVPVYHVSNLGFVAFNVACALAPSFRSLVAFRFLAGTFGSCPLTNGGGTIADMIAQERRAGAMAVFSVGPLLGPVLGPVAGGALQDAKGWRWVFWVVSIASGFLAAVMAVTMRESYAPVLLARRTKRLRKETGDDTLRSRLDDGCTHTEAFRRAIIRPIKLLIFSPICSIFALFLMMVYGYLYLLFTTVPFVFEGIYGFSATTVGLVYLGMGLGSLVGMGWFSVDSNREVKKKMGTGTDGQGKQMAKPEVRLKLLPIGALLLPVGFFIYGWTADFQTHWMAPIVGLTVIGVGEFISVLLSLAHFSLQHRI